MNEIRELDESERKVVRELIKNPRISDNQIAKNTKVPVMSVNRKRKRLENEGLLKYFTSFDTGEFGTGTFKAKQIYIIKFKIGITRGEYIEKLEKDNKKSKETEIELRKDAKMADIKGKIGKDAAEDVMGVYDLEKEKEVEALVGRIMGMQKMLKDLSKGIGNKGDENTLKLIEDGVKKIMKDRDIESEADAYVIFYKENPELCKGGEE